MFIPKSEEIQYWSDRLAATEKESAYLLEKYHREFKLSYEETYLMMQYAQDYASYTRLLAKTVARPDDPKKKFWNRKK